MFSWRKSFAASCSIRASSTAPTAFFGKRPRNRLSSTFSSRHWFSSWWTMAIPFSSASLGVEKWTSLPERKIFPSSRWVMPNRHFIIVDLPAPFSPISPRTEPSRTSRSTRSSTRVLPNALLSPRMDRTFFSFDPAASPAVPVPGVIRGSDIVVSPVSVTWRRLPRCLFRRSGAQRNRDK